MSPPRLPLEQNAVNELGMYDPKPLRGPSCADFRVMESTAADSEHFVAGTTEVRALLVDALSRQQFTLLDEGPDYDWACKDLGLRPTQTLLASSKRRWLSPSMNAVVTVVPESSGVVVEVKVSSDPEQRAGLAAARRHRKSVEALLAPVRAALSPDRPAV